MKVRNWTIVLGVTMLMLLSLVAASLIRKYREPAFEGKSLSYWLIQYDVIRFSDTEYWGGMKTYVHAKLAVETIGPKSLPLLVELAGRKDGFFKKSLMKSGEYLHVRALSPMSADCSHHLAETGFELLREQAAPAVPELVLLLKDKNPEIQDTALRCLEDIRGGAVAAVPALIEMLGNKDTSIQRQALSCLITIGPAAAPAIPKLLEAMDKTNSTIGLSLGLDAIGSIGPSAHLAAPFVFSVMNHGTNVQQRLDAELALVRMQEIPLQTYFERLQDFSDSTNWSARAKYISWTLRTYADSAIPYLVKGLAQTNVEIQWMSLSTIYTLKLRLDLCVPSIVTFIKAPMSVNSNDYSGESLRSVALMTLCAFPEKAALAVPTVLECLKDENKGVREHAIETLYIIDPEAAAKADLK